MVLRFESDASKRSLSERLRLPTAPGVREAANLAAVLLPVASAFGKHIPQFAVAQCLEVDLCMPQ